MKFMVSITTIRAVARVLFQPSQRGKPGSGGRAPSGIWGQPLVRGPLKLKAFQ